MEKQGSFFVAALLVGVVVVLSVLLRTPVSATHDGVPAVGDPGCPHGGNPGADACLLDVTHHGVEATWPAEFMTMDPLLIQDGFHVNTGLWTYSGSPCNYWVEVGLTKGFHGSNVYAWYYAKSNAVGYGDWLLESTTANRQPTVYYLTYVGPGVSGGKYEIYKGGRFIDWFENLGFGSCRSATGLEVAVPVDRGLDSGERTDNFVFSPLRYQNTAWGWVSGWTRTDTSYTQYPCGQFGLNPPRCLNGFFYSTNRWDANKP